MTGLWVEYPRTAMTMPRPRTIILACTPRPRFLHRISESARQTERPLMPLFPQLALERPSPSPSPRSSSPASLRSGAADPWLSFAFVGLFLGLVNSLVKPSHHRHLAAAHVSYRGALPAGGKQLHARTRKLALGESARFGDLHCRIRICAHRRIIVSIMCTILGVVNRGLRQAAGYSSASG